MRLLAVFIRKISSRQLKPNVLDDPFIVKIFVEVVQRFDQG